MGGRAQSAASTSNLWLLTSAGLYDYHRRLRNRKRQALYGLFQYSLLFSRGQDHKGAMNGLTRARAKYSHRRVNFPVPIGRMHSLVRHARALGEI